MTTRLIRFPPKGPKNPATYSPPVQLSLFDFRPKVRVLCLAMRDLHGRAFVRALQQYQPQTILDLRSHPYFDLHTLGRNEAFAAFRDSHSVYCHRPLDMRLTETHSDRWRIMREAALLFNDIASELTEQPTFALLHHRENERCLIEGALSQAGHKQLNWEVVAP